MVYLFRMWCRAPVIQLRLVQQLIQMISSRDISLISCNSSTTEKILQADMQLITRSDDYLSTHIRSPMKGLALSRLQT